MPNKEQRSISERHRGIFQRRERLSRRSILEASSSFNPSNDVGRIPNIGDELYITEDVVDQNQTRRLSLTDRYLAPKEWESKPFLLPHERIVNSVFQKKIKPKTFYEHIGIKFFKKWVPTSGDFIRKHILKQPDQVRVGTSLETEMSLHIRKDLTEKYEKVHVAFLGVTLPIIILASYLGGIPVSLVDIVMQLAVNVYPIMLQRYNRIRLNHAIEMNKAHNVKQQEIN